MQADKVTGSWPVARTYGWGADVKVHCNGVVERTIDLDIHEPATLLSTDVRSAREQATQASHLIVQDSHGVVLLLERALDIFGQLLARNAPVNNLRVAVAKGFVSRALAEI